MPPTKGVDEAKQDVERKNMRYTAESKVMDAADEKKSGGRAGRKYGGRTGGAIPDTKRVGPIRGAAAMRHAGKTPRAKGGGCDANPFTSAQSGTPATGRSV
jgi:hypothetical protein